MKKYILYIGILIVGILLGYVFFGNVSEENSSAQEDETAEAATQLWTCSMHPQIKKHEPGDCPICGMELIPVDADESGLTKDQFRMTPNAMALANVETTVIGKAASAGNTLSLSGKIEENEEANQVQVAYVAGRIEQLNVNSTGEEVKRGQLLATVYSPELIAAQQELLTTASVKKSQPQLYQAVRNKLKSWKISDSQIDAIEQSGKVKENFPIYATVSGTVTEKMVERGDYLDKGEVLLKIANLSRVWAVFDAYENQIEQLKKGDSIEISAQALTGTSIKGKIDFINPSLNSATRTVKVRAVLNNKAGLLKPGMFVEGKVQIQHPTSSKNIRIPKSAVLWTGKRSVIYVKTSPDEPVFEMREVDLGKESGDEYSISNGLKAGDVVVTNGTFTVDAAAQLQGKRSMMNHQPAITSSDLSKKTLQQLTNSVESYLKLKDALVASQAKDASDFAGAMRNGLNDLQIPSEEKALKEHVTLLIKSLGIIQKRSELELQREEFIKLSENVIAMTKMIPASTRKYYVQKCPMANDNEGARWLSTEKTIRNPYYGDKMMTCGSVIDSI